MKIKTILAVLSLSALSCAYVHAAGPGGDSSGGGPGGDSSGGGPGGQSGGGPGGEPGGGGQGGSFTYDSFISVTTNAYCLVREGTLYGYTSSLTTSVAPTSSSTVSALADGVFAGNTTITTVNLANTSITEIPPDCFAGCTALKTVTLPASCTTIGAGAFAGCTALATVTGSGVATVSHDAFRDCTALTSPSLPATVGSYAYSQSGATGVDMSGVTTLGEGAFAGCESLTAVTVASGASLPAATFAGCTVLNVGDWSGVSAFGQAALAGIPATTLTLSSSATLGAYAFAADEATVTTTLDQSALPTYDETAFLGREVSYTPVAGSTTRIEAMDLVDWLLDATASAGVTQPADYNTATLKTWLSDSANAYAYAYADDLAADEGFIGLTVEGKSFIYNAPSDSALSITIEPVACYTLSSDESDWSADNLTWSDADNAYFATDTTQTSCFARLRFGWDW